MKWLLIIPLSFLSYISDPGISVFRIKNVTPKLNGIYRDTEEENSLLIVNQKDGYIYLCCDNEHEQRFEILEYVGMREHIEKNAFEFKYICEDEKKDQIVVDIQLKKGSLNSIIIITNDRLNLELYYTAVSL